MSAMRISQLAKACGVPASTLRFYESTGLLPADRTPAGYRTYGPDAVDRLRFIGTAKHLGLSLTEIGELLHVWESGTCAQVKASMHPRIATQLAETESRTADLSAFAATLRATLAHLEALPDRADRCDPTCQPPTPPHPNPDPHPHPHLHSHPRPPLRPHPHHRPYRLRPNPRPASRPRSPMARSNR
jgi:MerR family transcriptional regulator, copper efflux regulator